MISERANSHNAASLPHLETVRHSSCNSEGESHFLAFDHTVHRILVDRVRRGRAKYLIQEYEKMSYPPQAHEKKAYKKATEDMEKDNWKQLPYILRQFESKKENSQVSHMDLTWQGGVLKSFQKCLMCWRVLLWNFYSPYSKMSEVDGQSLMEPISWPVTSSGAKSCHQFARGD